MRFKCRAKKQHATLAGQITELNIKAPDVNELITSLSGGNQQKIMLSKRLLSEPRVLILDNPTQGVDVGAKEDFYAIIENLAAQGMAVAVLSSDPQEIVRVCDRALVMYHGRVYAVCGLMCAIAAVIYVARIGSMDFANAGNGYEMDSIAGVIVGGTAMSGGRGSVIGAFFGMLIIGVINSLLNMLGVPTFLCDAVRGAIIIVAVLVQYKARSEKG